MAEPMSILSPEKLNSASNPVPNDDMTWHDPPSSPFVSHLEHDDQENIAPTIASTPVKPLLELDNNDVSQSVFKVSPEKRLGLKERVSPVKIASRQLYGEFEEGALKDSTGSPAGFRKSSPVKQPAMDRPELVMNNQPRKSSPMKTSRNSSVETTQRLPISPREKTSEIILTPSEPMSSPHKVPLLRNDGGLTVAMRFMEEMRGESHETSTMHHARNGIHETDNTGIEDTDFSPDGPELSSLDMDDTCFSAFSEMPGIDMTKFATMGRSPTRNGLLDQPTPRARAQMTPSTVRRTERTPSPTPRRSHNENETTNLLLDFTAQLEAFSSSHRGPPTRDRASPPKPTPEPNLASYYQSQRSPAKAAYAQVPATPSHSRHMFNLLDFELPPPPTPRSVPTVTIRELESLKSNFQSQISSLTASLSGKEAQVESLVQAISDAERRVGEAQETLRDERSAREHAEAQMTDWKKKGEEVQNLLQDVQSELARNDTEREQLMARLNEAEKRAEEADVRTSELETKLIEAESKNVDMTTLVNPDEESRKVYSEIECQTAIAEKVKEVARDLHSAYKAKHEKKIKALKDNYQKKADERCKELRVQIGRLERQVEEAEKKRDDGFSKVLPGDVESHSDGKCNKCGKDSPDTPPSPPTSRPKDLKLLEAQKSELENIKARLAGLQSELHSLHTSHDGLLQDLKAERVEKGELVAAVEQMLSLSGEKMEVLQQEELRKSQTSCLPPTAPPAQNPMRSTGFLAGGGPPTSSALGVSRPGGALGGERAPASGISKPSGLRAPGGFGYGSGSALSRSTSGGKSRILSNIERMGGGSRPGQE